MPPWFAMAESPLVNVEQLYRDRFSDAERSAKALVWRVLCDEFFSRFVNADDTVLDIACGYGEFINAIHARQRIAMDVNREAGSFLDRDVIFFNQSCENLDCIADGSVDVVFESNTFEHFLTKEVLARTVQEVHRKLRSGGRFIAMQPNIKYLAGDYWDFFDHYIPLSHLSCVELFQNCGFVIERVIPKFLPYTTKNRMPKHPFLVKWYLKLSPAWRLLGKQFLIVASKP